MEVRLSDLISICQGPGLNESLDIYIIQIQIMLNIIMGYSTWVKWNKHGNLPWLKVLFHYGLMYLTKV